MSLNDTAKLAVVLSLDDKQFNSKIGAAQGKVRGFGASVAKGLGGIVDKAVLGGVGLLVSQIGFGLKALKDDAVTAAQTTAVIKSTGGAAGVTAAQVDKLANSLSMLNGVDDNTVQGVENLLLTFTSIKSNIFPQVTQAALDMSAALGVDASNAAIQLGKALNDPATGYAALKRSGVSFSGTQLDLLKNSAKLDTAETKHYKTLLATNKAEAARYLAGRLAIKQAAAQALILKELQTEFGGVAKAQADADPTRRLGIAVEKFQKALATGFLPVIEKIQTKLTDWLLKPETLASIQAVGDTISGLFSDKNIDTVAAGLKDAGQAIGTAIGLFNQLPPEVKALAIGAFAINKVTGGAVGGIAETFGKILGSGLQKIFAANVTVIGTNVIGGGGPGGGPGGGGMGLVDWLAFGVGLAAWTAVGVKLSEFFHVPGAGGTLPDLTVRDAHGNPIIGPQHGSNPTRPDIRTSLYHAATDPMAVAGAVGKYIGPTMGTEIRNGFSTLKPPVVNVTVNTSVSVRDMVNRTYTRTSYGATSLSGYGGAASVLRSQS